MDLHVYRNSQDRWHDLRAAARAGGAVLATNAVTLDELVARLTPDLKTASAAQRLVLANRAVQAAGVESMPGLVRYAHEAIGDLKAARVRGSELRSAGAGALAAILEEYNRLIQSSGLADPQDRRWAAAGRVAESRPFDSVVIHAIYDLNDAEFTLLQNLIQRAPGGGEIQIFNATANIKTTQFAEWTWRRFIEDERLAEKTFPDFFRSSSPAKDLLERLFVFEPSGLDTQPLRPSGALRILECPGRYREVEAIGSEIAELLESRADANDIAIIVRHIDLYGEMLEDVLTRYAIPHSFETGVPLLRIPFIKYWMALLDLASSDRPREAMARVLSSAYYEPRLSPEVDIDRTLAEIGYIDRLHLSASALTARRQSPLTAELERFESLLNRMERASARPLQLLQAFKIGPRLTDRDRQAWRTLSEEIEAVDSILGEIPFTEFRNIVGEIAGLRTVDRFTTHVVAPGVPRVRVMAPSALGYRSYRWVFAPRFADGEIPASTTKNPLLPDATIDALNKIIRPRRLLNSRDRRRREPLYLFMLLDSAAERVTLTLPGNTLEGESISESIYIGEILRHYDPKPRVKIGRDAKMREIGEFVRSVAQDWQHDRIDDHHAERLLGADVVRRARIERLGAARGDLPAGSVSTAKIWNPSELNALAACPFVFLARHRLKLRAAELPDFEVPPAEVGNLAHRILREFYSQPVPPTEQAGVERMQEVIGRQLALVDIHGQGPSMTIDPALWKIRRPQLVRALLEYVKFAVNDGRDGYKTLAEYLDQPLPAAAFGDITLAGRPDHVAIRRSGSVLAGIRIDDFKYSAASSGTRTQLKQSFQIPVYAHLAAKALNAASDVSVEGRYLLLRSPSTPVVAQSLDASTMDAMHERVQDLVDKVRSGKLHPDPTDKQNCSDCEYRRLCRLYGT
jgi:RecB family exonuclease